MMQERRDQVGHGEMGCDDAARLVSAYLEGDLGPRAAEVVAHLETCRSCGMDYDAYRRLKARVERAAAS